MDAELRRLRKNLREKIRYYNKRGYEIDPSFIKELTLEELQNITTEELLTDIYYEQQEKQEEFEEYGIFPDEAEMIIGTFRDSYAAFNQEAVNKIDNWLSRIIHERGEWAVAVMLQEGRENGKEITSKEIYGNLTDFLSEFLDYLPVGYEMNNWEKGELMASIEEQYDDNSYWGF